MRLRPPRSALFPYTSLFRSDPLAACVWAYQIRSHTTPPATPASTASPVAHHHRPAETKPSTTIGNAIATPVAYHPRSEEHTPELQSRQYIVCRLLLEKK